jgi:hypothetical protein
MSNDFYFIIVNVTDGDLKHLSNVTTVFIATRNDREPNHISKDTTVHIATGTAVN